MVHVIALVAAALPILAQPAPRVAGVTAARAGSEVVVTVSLTAGAPAPAPRLLEGPWRLYFDIAGVLPGNRRLVRVEAGPVSAIRLALNQPSPPVTRVVIDLARPVAWRVDPSAGGRELRVVIMDVDQLPAAGGAPQGLVMYAPPADPAPARDRRAEIQSQLFAMRGVLQAMRGWTGPSDADLATLVAAVAQLSTGARAMQITGSQPDRALVAALDAVAAAADARVKALADGSAQSRANATAAAAGALVLLEHARALSTSR